MLILTTWSQTYHSCFPLFDVDHLEIANCSNLTIVFFPLGNFGQSLCIRSCHEDLILTRKSHNCAGIAFIQGDPARGSELSEQTLLPSVNSRWFECQFQFGRLANLRSLAKNLASANTFIGSVKPIRTQDFLKKITADHWSDFIFKDTFKRKVHL